MYDDIIHLAMDQQLLTEIRERDSNYKKLPLWRELQKNESTAELEQQLQEQGSLTFETVFHEPVGYHLMKSFLQTEHSVDKAVFIADVEVYKNLNDPRARENVACKIYEQFCAPEIHGRKKGQSVFRRYDEDDESKGNNPMIGSPQTTLGNNASTQPTSTDAEQDEEQQLKDESSNENGDDASKYQLSLLTENTNSIGVYGRPIKRLKAKLDRGNPDNQVFDEIAQEVYNDLRLDVFPRFCRSHLYQMYLRCKTIEQAQIGVRDFHQMRMLGRGAFGCVNACKKKDTGKLYAMKQINKKRVSATESAETIMSERNFLADMDSVFVTTLKYAFMDDQTLYLILDLMIGGDLKFHLNNDKTFSEERSRFYAAEVLLGLDHIHSKGIIYRDLKLENVLVDEKGHCKISDLGLAVRMSNDLVKGYAGTPGYTAPEVVLSHYYDHIVDFFSLGVMIYRFLCGKKPFQSKRRHHGRRHGENRQENQRRRTTELDRNVVEMEPDFPSQYFVPQAKSILKGLLCKNPKKRMGANGIEEIKQHPWFDSIDFGLLEAGYLDPPFVPSLDEIHAEQQQHIGRPPKDEIYEREKLKPEFDEQLKGFSYASKKVIQEEIVEVLKKVHAERRKSQPDNHDQPFNFDNVDPGRGDSCLGACIII
eukprot:CAMPEP_0201567764 /NCGR_PEP_ID=MMETSP0190_2-20130828/8393_1 /ASSEMBLY_ACC=CAM_ASM_000263 /TAXON_ID=37353 /ORGANISM="Rosalina sp." /LENGTH=648 /DNA_ID=CAMNT_0047988113 /DNA_START=111 /DNA_END=2057 /DNA_ORIENTATION=+